MSCWALPSSAENELQRTTFTCEPVAATVGGAAWAGLAASVGLAAAGWVAAGWAAGAAAVVPAGLAASVGLAAGADVGAGVAAEPQAESRVSPAAPARVLSRVRRVVRITVPS